MASAIAQHPALTLADYASAANETDRFAKVPQRYDQLRFGFFGEVGGLLAALKKVNRDQLKESETEVAGEEIGDALWYLVAVTHTQGVNPEQLGISCLRTLRSRFSERDRDSVGPINFRQFDGIVALHGHELEAKRTELLGELANASGEFVGHSIASQRGINESSLPDLFGALLALLALVSASFNLKLEDVARDNLVKILGRWPGLTPQYVSPFDEQFDAHEQLPREFRIEFIERGGIEAGHVVQRRNGVFIGDRLTDNSNEPDDYRFHDVFHLAYVAHLGWSPVIRALFKMKRKSRPEIDKNEDGARAMIIEEGIATWIFNHAKKRGFYEDIQVGKLDYSLLKQVHSMVSGYEVRECPMWQWEQAILEGFRVFRELRHPDHRGGVVIVNMIAHKLSFERTDNTT
ncbi:nucleoside triphosphate pyrophosphohydrolase family protein [Polaromonas sp. JS666]|uniref:nucleoside triphosphate pyrophosphohydrolase family protein n=1 Tax=Polaromonas sp. (strain JS666 / ATCC BAA-500) TaxID=296591 RepID=UPI000053191E|nr:nucleoside triphosphate pyrophosphohydrolase family protein [Polaromonas sp. JS666]ABE46627.1 hypothetical protein Bpro_4748 [Polaromonas sp. JS666]